MKVTRESGHPFLYKEIMQNTSDTSSTFENLGIAPRLLHILRELHYTHPTPIQKQSIPTAVEGKDVVGIAQTGTGKTLAFGIPMIQRIAQHKGQGLVILPTRELALQVQESLFRLGKPLGLRTAVLIGGESMHRQIQQLRQKPHIIIATPGRLIDHMQQKYLSLQHVNILVLDEADQMLDMGFAPQINEILKNVPRKRQTMLFSATMPATIMNIATNHMVMPIRIEVAPQGTTAEFVEQEVFIVAKDAKLNLLQQLLKEYQGTVLIFSRTKHGAKKMTRILRDKNHRVAELHSNKTLQQRRKALDGFKKGIFRILVATDIAARGIDVNNIEVVINYDLPDNTEAYVHRIGRTGRAGKKGRAISFAMPDQKRDVQSIERLIRKTLPISKRDNLTLNEFSGFSAPKPQRGYRGRRNFSQNRRPQGGQRRNTRPTHKRSQSRGEIYYA